MSTSTDAVESNLLNPKRVEGDGVKVEQHSLEDQIKAAQFIDGNSAASKPARGLRFTQLVRPGTA